MQTDISYYMYARPKNKTDSTPKRLTPCVLTMMGLTVANGCIMCHARSESWFVCARQNERHM